MPQDLFRFKDSIDTFLKYHPTHLSYHSFVPIFIWQDFFDFEMKQIDGNLCIFAKDKAGIFLYISPLGKDISKKCLQGCFDYMNQINKNGTLTRIENVGQDAWKKFDKNNYQIQNKSQEYIYQREHICQFKGNAYKSQRSSHNHFIKSYDSSFLPYEKSMREECLSLYNDWAKSRLQAHDDEMYRFMIEDNAKVHAMALKFSNELELVGRVVKINNKICGYTFGFPLDKDYFCILFEITDVTFKGLSAFIFREFCKDRALSSYQWINAMDDLGSKNMKQTKLSFHPVSLLPVYTIKENK
jgi:hypothetical protein